MTLRHPGGLDSGLRVVSWSQSTGRQLDAVSGVGDERRAGAGVPTVPVNGGRADEDQSTGGVRVQRKALVTVGIVLGVSALLVIAIFPAAPLWARLGVKPVCIQGSDLAHLRFVACPETGARPQAVTPSPLKAGAHPLDCR